MVQRFFKWFRGLFKKRLKAEVKERRFIDRRKPQHWANDFDNNEDD